VRHGTFHLSQCSSIPRDSPPLPVEPRPNFASLIQSLSHIRFVPDGPLETRRLIFRAWPMLTTKRHWYLCLPRALLIASLATLLSQRDLCAIFIGVERPSAAQINRRIPFPASVGAVNLSPRRVELLTPLIAKATCARTNASSPSFPFSPVLMSFLLPLSCLSEQYLTGPHFTYLPDPPPPFPSTLSCLVEFPHQHTHSVRARVPPKNVHRLCLSSA